MEYAVFRVEKIKTRAGLGSRAAHNLRVNPTAAPHADPAKKSQNRTAGARTVEAVQTALDKRLSSLAKPPRSNAVLAVELMLTASPEWFAAGGDLQAWAKATHAWISTEFGQENILTVSLHRDESTPHIQALIVPIHDGKLRAAHWFDGPKKLSELQTRYHRNVASLGLRRGEKRDKPSRHTSLREFYALTRQILARAKSGVPRAPKLPERGLLGNVKAEDWAALEQALRGTDERLAKLHAEALAGRIFLASSTGAELARRQAELERREKDAAWREKAIAEKEALAKKVIDDQRSRFDQAERKFRGLQDQLGKLNDEIEAKREALQINQLEAYRHQLQAEVRALLDQRKDADS